MFGRKYNRSNGLNKTKLKELVGGGESDLRLLQFHHGLGV